MFLLLTLAGVSCLTREVLGIDCKPGSHFAYPLNCESYYICDENSIAQLFNCSKGLHFNQANNQCDWPENAKCSLGTPIDNAKAGVIQNSNVTYNKSTESPQLDQLGEVLSEVLGKTFGILDLNNAKGNKHISEPVIKKERKDEIKTNQTQSKQKTDSKLDAKKVVITNIELEVSTEGSKEENRTGPVPNIPFNETNKTQTIVNENKKEKRTAKSSGKQEKDKSLETSKEIDNLNSSTEATTEEKKEEENYFLKELLEEIYHESEVPTEEKSNGTVITNDELPENPFRYPERPFISAPVSHLTSEDLKSLREEFEDTLEYKTEDQDGSEEKTTTNNPTVSVESKKIAKGKKEDSSIHTKDKKPNGSSKGKVIDKTNPSSSSTV